MSETLADRRRRVLAPSYRLFYDSPLHLVRGEGVWLWDADGRRYLDCYNNVASVGHCHPRVVEALSRQAAKLNTHTRYLHENVVAYAERLAALLPGDLQSCIFVCTGSEANDLAYRIARCVTGHAGAIVLEHAYHGNSWVTAALSTEMYPPSERPDWVETVPAPDAYRSAGDESGPEWGRRCAAEVGRALTRLAARDHRPAVFIADSIYSSSGVLTPPPEYLQDAYRQVRAAGGLVIADEVQAGLCRLGDHWWGFEDSAVIPDIVTLGKPMGDGHPLAAVITTAEIAADFAARHSYFNTFGGNPVAAAVGMAVLDVIEEEAVLPRVHAIGNDLAAGLRRLAQRFECIGDVRGKGLFFGIEMVRDRASREPAADSADRLREQMREYGVLLGTTGPGGNVVKIRPPLIFSRDNADRLLEELERALVVL
jgi:4-aminobutyrate aminotransferase-like enzyme